MRVQLLEIYNEQLRDLLDAQRTGKRLDIRNTERSGLNVPDAIQVPCPRRLRPMYIPQGWLARSQKARLHAMAASITDCQGPQYEPVAAPERKTISPAHGPKKQTLRWRSCVGKHSLICSPPPEEHPGGCSYLGGGSDGTWRTHSVAIHQISPMRARVRRWT